MTPDNFDDIRSYRDDEVIPVLSKLYHDDEFTRGMKLLATSSAPKGTAWLIGILFRWLWPLTWKRLTRQITDVYSLQMQVKGYLNKVLAASSDGVSCSGMEHLQPTQPYLFISNHRDIAMDPALINLMLTNAGFNIPHLAIGDNLLSKQYASDLMRLNRSFIVQRNIQGGRKLLAALKQLSAYIRQLREVSNANVWIAQRDGRAKDGIDNTDEAVLKMLLLNAPREQSLNQNIADLNIVPVSISYEWDPCDIDKARSMIAIAQTGSYIKDAHEDIFTIGKGIRGDKGQIHVHFSPVIDDRFNSTESLAAHLNQEIVGHYKLYPSHFAACELLATNYDCVTERPERTAIEQAKRMFHDRLADVEPEAKQQVLQSYANSVIHYVNTIVQPEKLL